MKKAIIALSIITALAITLSFRSRNHQQTRTYEVITATTLPSLQQAVSQRLRDNWNLAGGISYADGRYMQAVYE